MEAFNYSVLFDWFLFIRTADVGLRLREKKWLIRGLDCYCKIELDSVANVVSYHTRNKDVH